MYVHSVAFLVEQSAGACSGVFRTLPVTGGVTLSYISIICHTHVATTRALCARASSEYTCSMKCPVDSFPLEPIALSPTITVYRCASCSGLWIGHEAFRTLTTHYQIGKEEERLYDTHTAFTTMPPDADVAKHHRGDDRRYPCPEGHGLMSEHRYAGDSGVFIDQCPVCRGIWLDTHELAHIREHLSVDEEREAVARAYATFLAESKASDAYEQQKAALLFSPLMLAQPMLFLNVISSFVHSWLQEQQRRARREQEPEEHS